MKLYRFPENRLWKAAFPVYLFVLLLLARDTLYTQAMMSFYTSQILMLLVMGLGVLAFVVINRRELKSILLDRRMLFAIFFAFVIIVPMVAKRDWQLMYFSILLCVLFAVYLSYFMTMEEVARTYVLLLCGLAVYSLLAAYVLRILPDMGLITVPTFANSRGREFYNFGLGFASIVQVKSRNFGIFREPGVYQYFILLALYLTNYHVRWKRQSHMWAANALMAVTMVSTMATGGLIELILFACVLFFDKKMYRNRKLKLLAIIGAAVLAVVLIISFATKNAIYWLIYDILIEKFVNRSDSVTERTEAILVDLQIFLRHPIFGAKISEVLYAVRNNTTSTMILYAVFGFLGGCVHVASWAALVWKRERHVIWNLGLLAIFFMAFNTQNLTADVFFWLFPVMAICERVLPLLKAPKKG